VQSVNAVLRQAAADLDAIGARWAVIGGLAVAFRAEPRFTKDVDVAVAAADDREAEDIVNRLQARGYALASPVEPGSRQPPGDGAADSHHEGRLSLVAQSPE
jgi:predicted HAD superfamily phosphohydrolase